MDFEHRKASSELRNASAEHEKAEIHATIIVDNHVLAKPEIAPKSMEERSCSTSSTSSTLSDEDFFQIDTNELSKPTAGLNEMPRNNLQSPLFVVNTQVDAGKYEVKNGQGESMTAEPWMPFSPPYVSGASPGFDNIGTVGAKQSPSIQLMCRSDVPDPNRIPASIFARTKSTTPMEWSVASNESLFSIQMGKSGDLTSLYSNPLDGYPSITPHIGASSAKRVGVGPGLPQTVETEEANAEAMKDDLKATREEHDEKEKPLIIEGIPHSDSTSHFSDGSVNSYRSFAFPILIPEGRNDELSVRQPFKKEKSQQPLPQPERLKAEQQVKVESPKSDPVSSAHITWFPRFSCFSCCSFHC